MPELNYTDPINRDHPLGNKIAQGNWWKVLPDGPSGLSWRDLCDRNPGTLTGGASWSQSLSPFSRNGSIQVAGASQELLCGVPKWIPGATRGTIAAWIYRGSNAVVAGGCRASNSSGLDRFGWVWFTNSTLYFSCENGSEAFSSTSLAGTGWHHIVMAYDGSLAAGSRVAGYVDGRAASLSTSGTAATSLASSPQQFGFGRDTTTRWSTGNADDIIAFPYTVNANEARQLYEYSLQEYSPLLNWDHDDWWWNLPEQAAGSSFQAAWALGSNVLVGAN